MANVLVEIGDFFAVAAVPPPFLASHFHIELIPMTHLIKGEPWNSHQGCYTTNYSIRPPSPASYEVFDILHQVRSLFIF